MYCSHMFPGSSCHELSSHLYLRKYLLWNIFQDSGRLRAVSGIVLEMYWTVFFHLEPLESLLLFICLWGSGVRLLLGTEIRSKSIERKHIRTVYHMDIFSSLRLTNNRRQVRCFATLSNLFPLYRQGITLHNGSLYNLQVTPPMVTCHGVDVENSSLISLASTSIWDPTHCLSISSLQAERVIRLS